MNPENLTQKEIQRKIEHLEHSIIICILRSGPRFCVNREKRVKVLKSYLEKRVKVLKSYLEKDTKND